MASPVKLAHVVYKTGQLTTMVEWYRSVLEARVVYANDMLAFITYDDEHHRMAFVSVAGAVEPTGGHSGLHHVAFTYASIGDLLGTYERLAKAGVDPFWCVNHGPTLSMYFEDPDGNHVELQIDNFDTDEELEAFFSSGAFDANPIGVAFNPDELLERFKSGASKNELVGLA